MGSFAAPWANVANPMISLFGKSEPTLLERLKESVARTRTELSARVEQILTGDRPVDPGLLKELETALLSADIGVRTTREVIAALRQQVNEHKLAGAAAQVGVMGWVG